MRDAYTYTTVKIQLQTLGGTEPNSFSVQKKTTNKQVKGLNIMSREE